MRVHTISRDKMLYNAEAEYDNGSVVVMKGSKINRINAPGFKPKKTISSLREKDDLFENYCYLKEDVAFTSLSDAATFVTGRIANGRIVWKTENGKYVRYALSAGGDE